MEIQIGNGLKFGFVHTRRRGEPLIQINPRLEEDSS